MSARAIIFGKEMGWVFYDVTLCNSFVGGDFTRGDGTGGKLSVQMPFLVGGITLNFFILYPLTLKNIPKVSLFIQFITEMSYTQKGDRP